MRWGVVAGAVLAACLAGCGGPPNDARITSSTLTIFTGLPLRGERGADGRAVLRGEKLALEEAGGRVGRWSISLSALDDTAGNGQQWQPGQVAANARQAAQNPTVIAYIGDLSSGATAVSLPITNETGILQVSPLSDYTGLTRPNDKGEPEKFYPSGQRTFARLVPNGDVEAQAIASWLRRRHIGRVALAYDGLQDGLGSGIDVSEALRDAHVKVTQVVRINPRAKDASNVQSESRALAQGNAGAMVYAGGSTQAALVTIRAVHDLSPGQKFVTTDGVADDTFAAGLGGAASQTLVVSPLLGVAQRSALARRMAARYRATFGGDPPPAALYGYEAMRSVLAAIRRAGHDGNDRRDVIRSYMRTRVRDSVLGPYAIDSDGDTTATTYGGFGVVNGHLRFMHRLHGTGPAAAD